MCYYSVFVPIMGLQVRILVLRPRVPADLRLQHRHLFNAGDGELQVGLEREGGVPKLLPGRPHHAPREQNLNDYLTFTPSDGILSLCRGSLGYYNRMFANYSELYSAALSQKTLNNNGQCPKHAPYKFIHMCITGTPSVIQKTATRPFAYYARRATAETIS